MSGAIKNYKLSRLSRKSVILFSNSKQTKSTAVTTAHYCLESVKKYDYENFICAILLRNTATRSCAFAVRSFNVELSKVADQVSQEHTALMRLQFWEETLEKCLTKDLKLVPKHPVAMEIYKVNAKNQLSKRYFNNLISSRKGIIKMKTFDSLENMEKYAEKSVSNVLYLILEGSGIKNIHADHAASHLGKAQGIVQHIRSIPLANHIHFIPIPQDILLKNRVSQEEILRGKSSAQLIECVYEIAVRAHNNLLKARNLSKDVPQEAKGVLLSAVPVDIYLDRLQKVGYDVFHPSLRNRSWKLLPRLWITNLKNKY